MARPAMGPLTSDFLCIDLNRLRRWGWLRSGRSRSASMTWDNGASLNYHGDATGLRLNYTHAPVRGGPSEAIEDFIPVTYTESGFGGRRAWLQCPSCRRQCGKLYGGKFFRCRLCV